MPEPLIAASFAGLLSEFAGCFTAPSLASFQHLVSGWVLCIGRHTITGLIRAAGVVGVKHHTSFQRFFRDAVWSPDAVGHCLLRIVLRLVPAGQELVVTVDDTLARHTGKRISSAGMHWDALLSTATKAVFHFGHVWVVVAVVVRVPKWNKDFSLPIFARLYRSKSVCEKQGRVHRKKAELAVELIKVLKSAAPEHRVCVVGDTTFSNRGVLRALPQGVAFVGRGVMDAAVFAPPPRRKSSDRGRPRVKGRRLRSPGERAVASDTKWETISVRVYGKTVALRAFAFNAVWYKGGKSCFVRFVVVRDWPGHDKDDVFVCTDTTRSAKSVIETYSLRWTLEVAFYWCKGKLGLEEPQNRAEEAVLRTAPMALWSYTLVICWYLTVGHRLATAQLPNLPWYSSARAPTFSDMLATLRRETWKRRFLDRPRGKPIGQKTLEPLLEAVGYG